MYTGIHSDVAWEVVVQINHNTLIQVQILLIWLQLANCSLALYIVIPRYSLELWD